VRKDDGPRYGGSEAQLGGRPKVAADGGDTYEERDGGEDVHGHRLHQRPRRPPPSFEDRTDRQRDHAPDRQEIGGQRRTAPADVPCHDHGDPDDA
jgi:hypothetical protein